MFVDTTLTKTFSDQLYSNGPVLFLRRNKLFIFIKPIKRSSTNVGIDIQSLLYIPNDNTNNKFLGQANDEIQNLFIVGVVGLSPMSYCFNYFPTMFGLLAKFQPLIRGFLGVINMTTSIV